MELKKRELSVLIPAYNHACAGLVRVLQAQAAILPIDYEIIVAEDGSTDLQALSTNADIAALPHCCHLVRAENVGRAAIRNFLALQSRYEWLLFLDCDVEVDDARFLRKYLSGAEADVTDGGISIACDTNQTERSSLRFLYENSEAPFHTAHQRRQNPYKSFRTTNFLVRRSTMLSHPFDERFRQYGYEDVLFGKELKMANVRIEHTENPVIVVCTESNNTFVAKTEEALQTLHRFRSELRGYSRLLTLVEGIHIPAVLALIRLWHRLLGRLERHNLCGTHPSLKVFKLYKLGYFLTLKD